MEHTLKSLSKFVKPAVWSLGFLSTLMFLNLYDAESFVLSFIILVIGAMGSVLYWPKDGALTVVKSPVVILLFAFWALAFVSAVFSEVFFTSFIFFCFLGALPLTFFMSSTGENKEHFFKVIFIVSSFVYAAISIAALLQYFFAQDLIPWGLTAWPMANPNSLAGFLSLGFFCAYGASLYSRKKLYKAIFFALSLLIITAMYTTGGRGALLSLIGSFGILTWLLFEQIKREWKMHSGFVAMAVLTFILLAVLVPDGARQPPHKVLFDSLSGQMPLMWHRFDIWASTWDIIQDNFWIGTGVGTFFYYYPEYRGGDTGTSGHMAHNDLLQFWSEMGVLAPVIFLSLIGAAIYKTFSVLKILDKDNPERILVVAPFCAFGAMVLHTQISFHFYVLPILFVAGTLLGFWFVQTQRVLPSGRWVITRGSLSENSIVKICVMVLLLCGTFMLVSFQGSEILVDRAKASMRRGDVGGFVTGINLAGKLSFMRSARAMALASTVPSSALRSQGEALDKDAQLALYKQAASLLDGAIRNNPRLASAYHEKALLVEYALRYFPEEYRSMVGGDALSAQELVEKALSLNPLHPGTRVKLARILLRDGKKDQAYEVLKDGKNWPYNSYNALTYYNLLAREALEQGEKAVADEALARAEALRINVERQKQKNEYKKNNLYARFLLG